MASSLNSHHKKKVPEDKNELAEKLRYMVRYITPLHDEEDFHVREETVMRFLKARDWVVKDAYKQLMGAIEWRRSHKPLTTECKWCHEQPGYHSIRQVGFDLLGRPVVYSCFAQAETHKNTVEDTVSHCTYLIENAQRTMAPGVGNWVFVIDCTGMTLPCCNPKLGFGVINIFASYYPERLGKIIVLNHNPVFHGVWQAIKVFIDPNTVQKMKLLRSKEKMNRLFTEMFSPELIQWLMEEIRLNKEKISESQRRFWEPPSDPSQHDPRGSPEYISRCVKPLQEAGTPCDLQTHKPHPNIVDNLTGSLKDVQLLVEVPKEVTPEEVDAKELEEYGVSVSPEQAIAEEEANGDDKEDDKLDESQESSTISKFLERLKIK